MMLLIQSIILCTLFTLALFRLAKQGPLKAIMSYPKAIRKRVEALPMYQDSIQSDKKTHMKKKLVAIPIVIVIIAGLAWIADARDFGRAFIHSLILFSVVNLYDLIILDWLWFRNSRQAIIPGTEDMIAEYKSYSFHFKGFLIGMVLGLIMNLLSAGLVSIIQLIYS